MMGGIICSKCDYHVGVSAASGLADIYVGSCLNCDAGLAYFEGRRARECGIPKNRNPYPSNELPDSIYYANVERSRLWDEGWESIEKEAEHAD